MSDVQYQRDDHYYEELIGVAAFGHLDAEDRAGFDAYIARSPHAREELAELLSIVNMLPLGLEEASPSSGLRDRIANAVGAADPPSEAHDSPSVSLVREPNSPSGGNVSWISSRTGKAISAAAAVVLIAVAAIIISMNLGGTDAQTIDLATAPEGVTGTLKYEPDNKMFVFESSDMPEAPADHVYQVWLIAGDNPESVGVMQGSEFEVEADRSDYDAFAITIEPAPDGSAGPTTDPIVVAPLNS